MCWIINTSGFLLCRRGRLISASIVTDMSEIFMLCPISFSSYKMNIYSFNLTLIEMNRVSQNYQDFIPQPSELVFSFWPRALMLPLVYRGTSRKVFFGCGGVKDEKPLLRANDVHLFTGDCSVHLRCSGRPLPGRCDQEPSGLLQRVQPRLPADQHRRRSQVLAAFVRKWP